MEEKLRNLSQNIAANTGDEHKPKHRNPEEEAPKEEESHEEPHEESQPQENAEELQEKLDEQNEQEEHSEPEEEVSDYTPEPEDQPEEKSNDSASGEDDASRGGSGGHDRPGDGERSDGLAAEPRDDGSEERASTKASPTASEQNSKDEAKILTMDTEDEPQESPTRTKKYSPEVEAALDRLNAEDAAVDLSEPLSTEPKKKGHGAQIFLFILFLLAIAAVTLCILVEQKIIDNPFPNIFNKTESSQTTTVDKTTPTSTETKTETEGGTTEPTRNNTNTDIKEQE